MWKGGVKWDAAPLPRLATRQATRTWARIPWAARFKTGAGACDSGLGAVPSAAAAAVAAATASAIAAASTGATCHIRKVLRGPPAPAHATRCGVVWASGHAKVG